MFSFFKNFINISFDYGAEPEKYFKFDEYMYVEKQKLESKKIRFNVVTRRIKKNTEKKNNSKKHFLI